MNVFVAVLMLSSLLSIGYLMPVVVGHSFWPPAPWVDEHGHETRGPNRTEGRRLEVHGAAVSYGDRLHRVVLFRPELRALLLPR